MSSKNLVIYALHHDSSNCVYIGKSINGMTRPQGHGSPGRIKKYSHLPISKWIIKLNKLGLRYQISILETCETYESLNNAEKFYIAYLRSVGATLLNLTDGGDGPLGFKMSPESVKRRAATQRGAKRSEKTKILLSAAALRRSPESKKRPPRPAEVREKISAAKTGSKLSAQHLHNVTVANRKRAKTEEGIAHLKKLTKIVKTDEVRKNTSIAQQKRAATPEGRANLNAARELSHAPEAKGKQIAALRAYYASPEGKAQTATRIEKARQKNLQLAAERRTLKSSAEIKS